MSEMKSLSLAMMKRLLSLLSTIHWLFPGQLVVEGSVPFFDDISHEAHRHVILDYGGQHPFEAEQTRRIRSLLQADEGSEYNELQDASKQDVSYSTRDSTYAPIRIKFDTTLLESRLGETAERDAVILDILNNALPRAGAEWAKHLYTVPVRSAITVQPDLCFGIFGSALQETTSVTGADLVVVVSGQDEFIDYDGVSTFSVCGGSTLALASACELDQYDRPVVGFMNFCLDHKSSTDVENLQLPFSYFLDVDLKDEHIQIDKKEVALHELAHVLAFSSWMYKYFRHSDGTPQTERPFSRRTIQCSPDGQTTGAAPSTNTMAPSIDPITGNLSYVIATPRVKQVARNLLGCDTLEGARLAEGVECFGSHWHSRLFLGEVLSPVLTSSSENILSPLTLALMEDSGWYTVDYQDAATPAFGLAAGCEFATESCIQNDKVPEWGRDMFCSFPLRFGWDDRVSLASLNSVICDPSHRWWTVCDLWDAPTVPEDFEVEFPESSIGLFSNKNLVTSFGSTDSCPVPVRSLGYDCTQPNDEYMTFYPGERVGEDSRCVVASQRNRYGNTSYRPACMKTRCDDDQGKLVISLLGSNEHVCQFDGQTIRLIDGSELLCPRLASICPHLATCPSGCSGRGVCDYETIPPTCACDEGENQNPGCFPKPDRVSERVESASSPQQPDSGEALDNEDPVDDPGSSSEPGEPKKDTIFSSAQLLQTPAWISVALILLLLL